MPVNGTFSIRASDTYLIRNYPNSVTQIVQAQTSEEYVFEFHSGHEQGNPVYIRLAGDKTGSNIAKFTTERKTALNFSIVNQGYLLQDDPRNPSKPKMKQKTYDALILLIRANWAFLSALAAL